MNADDLISLILDDDKIKNNRRFADKLYRDEPIIFPASRLAAKKKTEIPAVIADLKAAAFTSQAVMFSEEKLFVTQGKIAEDYEETEDFPDTPETSEITYNRLDTRQLRAFFAWRTAVRKGSYPPAPLSFVRILASELINLIGVKTPAEAFEKLTALIENCSDEAHGYGGKMLRQLPTDLAVRYKLPPTLLQGFETDALDRAVITLLHCRESSDDELFQAVTELSDHNLLSSRGYKQFPDDYTQAVCAVIRSLSDIKCFTTVKPFSEWLFGYRLSRWYEPFRGAVFFFKDNGENYQYEINEVRWFYCSGRLWQEHSYIGAKNKKLGKILRDIDSILRERLGIKTRLNRSDLKKRYADFVEKALEEHLERKKEAAKPRIEFDLSKLDEIRRTSDITRDKLIVEEKEPKQLTETVSAPEPMPISSPEPAAQSDDPLPLDKAETAFLHELLYGGDFAAAAKSAGLLPSIIADSVNEKLFDMFGDTVIGFDGDTPAVIEDYAEELKGMIPQ